MQHVAIDLGSKESQICIRRPDGSILDERKYPTRKLVELVATWEPSRVVMETCSEAFKIADAAKAAGHEVRVVPGTLVRLLGVGERGIKNDRAPRAPYRGLCRKRAGQRVRRLAR